MTRNKLGARFRAREPLFGAWTSLGHPAITEIFADAGVDFVGIDLEHSTISQEQAQRVIAAAHAGGLVCLPRVASHNGEQIRRLLDSGADGIIVPSVETPQEVERIITWCKYPPLGRRSYGVARAQGYGVRFAEYVRTWNACSSVILQIESVAAAEAIEELLAFEAVDGLMIGPYDMSGSLGMPGDLDHPRVTQACARVLQACRQRGKACGTQVVDPMPERVAAALAAGYTFAVLASDVFILWKWGERMRQIIGRPQSTAAAVRHQRVRSKKRPRAVTA